MRMLKSIKKSVKRLAVLFRTFNRKRKGKDSPPPPASTSPADFEELAEAKPMDVRIVEMEPIEVIPALGNTAGNPTGLQLAESNTRGSPMTKLPAEMLLEVSSFLPPVPRMCLALTCKGFLEIIDYTKLLRQSSHFRLPRTGPAPFTLHRSPVLSPRWELLRKLENSR